MTISKLCHILCELLILSGVFIVSHATVSFAAPSYAEVVDSVLPKIAKIYGAGGIRGLEAYQSGFLISPDGHILTSWSYVLDTDPVVVVLNDGSRHDAEVVGIDPRLEIAVLKVSAQELDHFKLSDTATLGPGQRVLAFSNLYGVATGNEPASVQQGHVSAVTPLTARSGAFRTPYRGHVYVVDAMTNNAGATGGALTDRRGRLAGLLGKELRNALNHTWLNYAVPIAEVETVVEDILAGRTRRRSSELDRRKPIHFHAMADLGVILVPDVLRKTPPFVQDVLPDSPANTAGISPDDLIIMIDTHNVTSCKTVHEELSRIDRIDPVRITVLRGEELRDFQLRLE